MNVKANGDLNAEEAPLNPKPHENQKPSESPKKIVRRTRPWLESGLPLEYRGTKAPNRIIWLRNIAMIALVIQIASILAGFAFYFMRKNRVSLIINIISLVIMINGWWGVIFLSRWNTAIHGVFTSSIIGVFFLYSILEAFFKEDLRDGGNERYSDRGVLLLTSIPYFIDFLAGLTTFYLTFLLFKEKEHQDAERAKLEQQEPELELPADYDENSNLCCICMTREKNTVIYTCGHKALCFECSKILKSRSNKKCPICRRPIQDIILVYS